MCSIGERHPFDNKDWAAHETNDIATLRQRLDDMKLVGRIINDFRLTSFCYNMRIDDIEDTVYRHLLGYSDELRRKMFDFDKIDDYFPFSLYLEMDSPVLIRFEDGDCFEVDSSVEENYNISMNEIPWDAKDLSPNPENIDGSILFDSFKGVKITDAEVMIEKDATGREYINGLKLGFWYEGDKLSLCFISECHDYLVAYIEDWKLASAPFLQVKKSMYREFYI